MARKGQSASGTGRAEQLLKDYRKKRDFSKTHEPDHVPQDRKPGRAGPNALAYLIQKHDATRLHYDFRLEWEGVLKSWAVTRGPSLDPAEKRLAVRTEDHPLSYGSFEGTIPKGQYGGGTVMLWDRGTWVPEGDPGEGLKTGKLSFTLEGERLKGEWTLVRMRAKKGEKRENWLLIKSDDQNASRDGDILEKYTKSVESDRSMPAIAGVDLEPPEWQPPQLATLVDTPPPGQDWFVEMKYDGYRALISVAGGRARVFTRNGKDWTDKFPQIAEAAAKLPVQSALLDGEIAAFDKSGRTDFSTLQSMIKEGGAMLCFAFDLLHLDGEDLTPRPLRERKQALEKLLAEAADPLALSTHIVGHAGEVYKKLCAQGHEGIIAKRADDRYRAGRAKSWLKVKCTKRQELVIGGFSPSNKPERPFASLLLGVFEGEKFVYKGRVGTGFDRKNMQELRALLDKRARKTSPFADLPTSVARTAQFVTPHLVAEIEFTEFTADGYVRHGAFKGLRQDKKASEVVLETPQTPKSGHKRQ